MQSTHYQNCIDAYRTVYGGNPTHVVRAPGRVNLIGDHTDYNDGFVLPMAIDRWVWIALCGRRDGQIHLRSMEMAASAVVDLGRLATPQKGWAAYVEGVAWALRQAGFPLSGWQGVLLGEVPMGAGLSSSAALEMAVARAFATVSGFPWEPKSMALAGQRAENEWVGMNCGIMDQLISAAGQADHALCIDCRELTYEAVRLPPETAIVVLDTATQRGLVDSAYNLRRHQCEAGAAGFEVAKLRDVSPASLAAGIGELDGAIGRRVRHVVSENQRTLWAAAAMRAGDARRLGELMVASHTSLRDDFEVSSPALDHMVASALENDGCLGARMTGAGFGGCAVALVAAEAMEAFIPSVAVAYRARMGTTPRIYPCRASAGAEQIWAHDEMGE
ncbi:MAG: galactokinase [Desulfosarcinaceae bacterium]|nr:galactokinase [Desulfosarcinaceae bacterium]